MPASVPPVADERDALVAYVHQQQDALRAVTFGITAEQARRAASAPSTLSLGGLVEHVTMMQEGGRAMAAAAPGPLPESEDPEALDGATVWELIAGYEGWAETPWAKPWRASVEA